MLLEISDGTVSRGGSVILSDFHFYIKGTERAAIVGRNGAGKTTLLELLAGDISLDADEKHPDAGMFTSRAFTSAYLPQQAAEDPDITAEELLAPVGQTSDAGSGRSGDAGLGRSGDAGSGRSGDMHESSDVIAEDSPITVQQSSQANSALSSQDFFDTEQDHVQISAKTTTNADFNIRRGHLLKALGFSQEDLSRRFGEFSGGQQRKLLLIRLLLAQPEVLIMDEPTNHLDTEAVEWLEQEIRHYPGAIVMVSHDRYFLDRTADVVWEVANGRLTRYPGNYTRYRQEKSAAYHRQLKTYEAQQAEIARLEDLIRQFKHKPRKAAFARSRKKMLERMDRVEKPIKDDAIMHTGDILPARMSSRRVISCDDLLIGYEQTSPVAKVTFSLKRGQKIGIIGPNGSGKSTFLKTIAGRIPPLKGNVLTGSHVDIAYFDQMTAQIDSEESVMDWFHDKYPRMREQDIRTRLAGYLFSSRHMGTPVNKLSGGEKSRLVLAALLEAGPNLLILDEPTNNMDIPAMETMESIFRSYKGTILFVTHDRYFLNQVADSLMIFEGRRVSKTGFVKFYPFDYAHYQEQKDKLAAGENPAAVRSAEEQKLIDGLRAVPKKSCLPHAPSTASAQMDWDYRLNAEKVRDAEEKILQAQKSMQVRKPGADDKNFLPQDQSVSLANNGNQQQAAVQDDDSTYTPSEYMSLEEYMNSGDMDSQDEERAAEAEDELTEGLIEWYDLWQETHD